MIPHTYLNASDDYAAYAADRCNRQAVTAEFACKHLCDEPLYLFNEEADRANMDGWISVTGIDRDTRTHEFIIEHGRSSETKMAATGRLFAQRSTLRKLGLPEGEPGGRWIPAAIKPQPEMTMLQALTASESFISGFEDDELQEPPINPLLVQLRRLLKEAGVPTTQGPA